jgi:tetratricopeptide (TPR) repeat protein
MQKFFVFFSYIACLYILSSDAISANEDRIQNESHSEETTFSHINQLIKERQYDEALHQINQYIHASPHQPRAYKLRANLFFTTGHDQEAMNDFDRVADLLPHEASSYIDIAILEYYRKNYDAALGYIEHALTLKPNSPFAFKIKMLIMKEMKKPAK